MSGLKKRVAGKRRGVPSGRAATLRADLARKADIEACASRLGGLLMDKGCSYWDRVHALALEKSTHIPTLLGKEGDARGVPVYALRDAFRRNDQVQLAKFFRALSANDEAKFRRFEEQDGGPTARVGKTLMEAAARLRAQELAYQNRDMTPPVNEAEIADTIQWLAGRNWRDAACWPNSESMRRYFGLSRKVLMRVAKGGRWGERDVGMGFREHARRRGRPKEALSPRAVAKVLRHVAGEWPGVAEMALDLARKLGAFKK
jgi:hypothetical protein